MPTPDTISIIIPAHNAAATIERAIASAEGADEIIVCDDHSTDATAALAKAAGAIVVSSKHHGAAAARNEGLCHATGSILGFLDADDEYAPRALTVLSAPLRANPDLAAVFAYAKDVPNTGRPPYTGVLPGCALIRRHEFFLTGLFDRSLPAAETVDWLKRFRELEFIYSCINDITLYRHVHADNATPEKQREKLKAIASIIRNTQIRNTQIRNTQIRNTQIQHIQQQKDKDPFPPC